MGSERKKIKRERRVKVGNDDSSSDENVMGSLRHKKAKKADNSGDVDENVENAIPRKRKNANSKKKKVLSDIVMISRPILSSPSWNSSILHYLTRVTNGEKCISKLNDLKKETIMNQLRRFRIHKVLSPFDRRITAVTWHPVHSQLVCAASKGGELMLLNLNKFDAHFRPGIGAGGSVVALKFNANSPRLVYTASITGNVRQEDFDGTACRTYLSTFSWENWFSSLDVCYSKKLLLAGDTCGCGYLISTTGEEVWPAKKKLHGGKIKHVEFCKKDPNIFATASVDNYVKLWDLRMITDLRLRLQPIHEFQHVRSVQSATFSPSNGYNLLTTDQYNELRVYHGPNWSENIIINHPHRHFQHITPIKASWHPIEDIIVVGRYPDESFMPADIRTVDYYDGATGKELYRFNSPVGNIVSLNNFSVTGDCLASAAGFNLMFFKDENILDGVSFANGPDSEPELAVSKARMFKELKKLTTKANKKVQTKRMYLTF